ncbi:MAG: galactose-1-phosphate uridylyltransferase [Nitrospirae bacterium]|jgi:UDPglucose--hexose-1-phosphate uridylyltransferase|nr:galactose-1-phosphate uridylyltransferase [Nitrospirota bacterium]
MHELRKDILLGRWVAVLSDSKSPTDYRLPFHKNEESSCILCPGRENETPPEITSIRNHGTYPNSPGWWVRVLPSFKPVFQIEGDLGRRGVGIYDKMNSIGANEIIVESPEHNVRPEDMGLEHMIRVITLYRHRIADLEKDSRIRYILIYKNSGKEAGELFSHPVSYLMATPVIPKMVKDELDNAKQYYSYKERCIFCDIIREELRVGERIILETRNFIAFCPYAAQFPFVSWLIPTRHYCAFHEITYEEIEDLGLVLMTVLKKLRKIFNDLPFNYFIHTAPNMVPRRNHWHTLGEDFHWHLEIMPRLIRTSGFEWGSGFYILPTSPENAAKYLREVG